MGSLDHLDSELGAFRGETPPGAAIRVDHEDFVMLAAALQHGGLDGVCDSLGMKVKLRRKALKRHVVPAIGLFQRKYLAR